MVKEGVIYKITNTVNGKVYIGQTKEYYGEKKVGIEGRFKNHIKDASYNRKYGCVRLCNAIRKHGSDKFIIEKIVNCKIDERDDLEIKYIAQYKSVDPEFGYNISKGGKGRSVVEVSEEARLNISRAQIKNPNDMMNIKPVHKGGKLVGYRIKRRGYGRIYNKWFTSTKHTPEENLEFAKQWLEEFKNKTLVDNAYNKDTGLPKNIAYHKIDKEIAGYRVDIMVNRKKSAKCFNCNGDSMENTLIKAIQYRDNILKQVKTVEQAGKPVQDNPQPKP